MDLTPGPAGTTRVFVVVSGADAAALADVARAVAAVGAEVRVISGDEGKGHQVARDIVGGNGESSIVTLIMAYRRRLCLHGSSRVSGALLSEAFLP